MDTLSFYTLIFPSFVRIIYIILPAKIHKKPHWSTPAKVTCFFTAMNRKILPSLTSKLRIYCAQLRSNIIFCYSEREIIRTIRRSQLWGIEQVRMLQGLTTAYTIPDDGKYYWSENLRNSTIIFNMSNDTGTILHRKICAS